MRSSSVPFVVAKATIAVASLSAAAAPASPAELLPATPPEHVRSPDQTYLTFPEWFLVHSPAEYASYLSAGGAPSGFPLFRHIGQFWQGYLAVNGELKKYAFNGGYHLMVMVIGVSTTIEYAVKGVYEATVGRIFEGLTFQATPVPEENFAAQYAQAYVDFIRVDPWYMFDFWGQFKQLWSRVPFAGKNVLRGLERRFVLSTELLLKEGYARLIKLGTQSIYDAPKPVTAVILSQKPSVHVEMPPGYKLLSPLDAVGPVLATVPRYEAFTNYSIWLASQGLNFSAIAGNTDEVLVSFIKKESALAPKGRLLFTQPIITQPGKERMVVAVPVAMLGEVLRAASMSAAGIEVEHIYDF